MKYRIIFGVAIPIVVIVLLAIFGSLNIGFTVNENYKTEITSAEFYDYEDGVKQYIEIGSVDFENEYFLPRRYTLPALKACLIDKDNNKKGIDAGTISYSEGDLTYGSREVIYTYTPSKEYSIEISTDESKEVKIYLAPSYIFKNKPGTQLKNEYGDYDAIILLEDQRSVYRGSTSCYSLTPAKISEAVAEIKISL
jgi:hypothetical protein